MAFVYAMASAAVTSFIARACRDGQLTSCGCSRSARPKQLHEDWTWGGCGDDLEFGYKCVFSFSYSRKFIKSVLAIRKNRSLIASNISDHMPDDIYSYPKAYHIKAKDHKHVYAIKQEAFQTFY
jgi:hypothetical protein